jgi:hypothetical protein
MLSAPDEALTTCPRVFVEVRRAAGTSITAAILYGAFRSAPKYRLLNTPSELPRRRLRSISFGNALA